MLAAKKIAWAFACLLASGCVGRVAERSSEDDGRAGAGGQAGGVPMPPATPLTPGQLDELCIADAPFPRRLLRLAPEELVATFSRLTPVDAAAIPAGFSSQQGSARLGANLTVSRDFHESVDALAVKLAEKLVASPGPRLTCAAAEFGKNEACTRDYLVGTAAILFRGEARGAEIEALVKLSADLADAADGPTALGHTIRAMALSPRTLYLSEGLDPSADDDLARPSSLSVRELASFLSFRITGQPPSEALLRALAARPWREQGELGAILRDIFSPDELARGGATFLASLANVGGLAQLARDSEKHPQADAAFMQRLQDETFESIAALAKQPGADLHTILTAETRSPLLADDRSQVISEIGRPGLFTLPGVVAAMSNGDHTNIPRRGRQLLKRLFCQAVPSPPADLITMLPPLAGTPTQREKFEHIEKEPRCGQCHQLVNNLGYALESFDELGTVRVEDEDGKPIRADGIHAVAGYGDLVFSDARDLFAQASNHPAVQDCFAIQTFVHVARRDDRGAADACLIRDLARAGRADGFDLVGLLETALARIALAERSN